MAIYGKTAKKTVVDLINEANPELPFPINETDYEFSLPEVINPALENGHNTRIRLICKTTAPYIGNVVLTYRRINLAYLFRGLEPLQVSHWAPNIGYAHSNHVLYSDELLPKLSDKYGINLDIGHFRNLSLNTYQGIRLDPWALTANENSLMYVGSVSVVWEIGKRTLESLIAVDVLDGRQFPGGNVIDETHKYYVTPDSFGIDFTDHATLLQNLTAPTYWSSGYYVGYTTDGRAAPFINTILPMISRRDGQKYSATFGNPTGYMNTDFDLSGCEVRRATLPHVDFPEANAEFYNRAFIVRLPDNCPWGTGLMFFHYNVNELG